MKRWVRGALKTVVSLGLVAIVGVNIFSPMVAAAANSSTGLQYSDQLGKQIALGSPLLSSEFNPDNYNKWEMLTFGVFLSNFAVPLLDNYESAFSSGAGGSEGRGKAALQFASGNDSAAMESLQTLLNYAIKYQKSTMKEIQVKYTTTEYNTNSGEVKSVVSGIRAATIKDILPLLDGHKYNNGDWWGEVVATGGAVLTGIKDKIDQVIGGQGTQSTDINYSNIDKPVDDSGSGAANIPDSPYIKFQSDSTNVSTNIAGVGNSDITNAQCWNNIMFPEKMTLPTFTVANSEATSADGAVIFDFMDGWDIQIFGAWVTDVAVNTEYKDKLNTTLNELYNSNAALVLDNFGNICASNGGKLIVIIPAAANQHLTKTPKYNLINSLTMNGSYTRMPTTTVQRLLYNGSICSPLGTDSENTVGHIGMKQNIIYYSTETFIMQKLLDMWRAFGKAKSADDTLNFKTYAKEWADNPANFKFGEAYNQLLHVDTSEQVTSDLGLKISVIGSADENGWFKFEDKSWETLVDCAAYYSSLLSNMYPAKTDIPVLDYIHTEYAAEDRVFERHHYNSLWATSQDKYWFNSMLLQSSLRYMDGTNPAVQGLNLSTASAYRAQLSRLTTISGVGLYIYSLDTGEKFDDLSNKHFSPFVGLALANQSAYSFKSGTFKPESAPSYKLNQLKDILDAGILSGGTLGGQQSPAEEVTLRSLALIGQKFYEYNRTMEHAEAIMGVKEGTEFAVWTPWIYLTYLEWYGVTNGKSEFSEKIFSQTMDMFSLTGEELFSGTYLTAEEKEEQIRNYTYLMLNPTAGRQYRSNILLNWFADFIYNSYTSIVYGNSVNNYSGGLGTASGAGFLKFNNYEDNWLTGAFIEKYIEYATMIIAIVALLIVIVGVITRKKVAWFILSLVLMVNIVLLTPNIGNLAPTVANTMVQRIFESNMTYWSMAESIANFNTEAEYLQSGEGVTSEEAKALSAYTSMIKTVYLDRTLMIKTDISKKVVENSTGVLNEIQGLETARWLLPRLMRQYNANDGSKDYVYQSLGDMFNNWSNMFWVYRPDDRANVRNLAATASAGSGSTALTLPTVNDKATNYYTGYKDTSSGTVNSFNSENDQLIDASGRTKLQNAFFGMFNDTDGYYTKYGVCKETSTSSTKYNFETWQSRTRRSPDSESPHTAFYLLDGAGAVKDASTGILLDHNTIIIPEPTRKANGAYDWEKYAKDQISTDKSGWNSLAEDLQQRASNYDAADGTPRNLGFLWSTENPGHYFYQVVKETFMNNGEPLSKMVSYLQGNYQISSQTGMNARVGTMMHFQDTGDVRDILDLQEMFTNMLPYMYAVQVQAGGRDGETGVFEDNKLQRYNVYEDNLVSWLFRSNWVTKIMESPTLAASGTVRDASGTKYTVANMIDPGCYPEARPMVFSQAQQKALGLLDGDLSLAELKMVKINNTVERKWTLILNYINTTGVNQEVLCRQMALDALLVFDQELSVDGLLSESLKMYPRSVDLRSLSFDSVMRLLMINSTRNSNYVYGDTMKTVIENSDILSAFLMLAGAFICSTVIPLVRDTVLGLMFYLGIWSVLCNIFSGGRAKLKTMAAYTINHVAYLLLTLAFYGVFGLLINITTVDEVLSVGNIAVSAGPPTAQFVVILVASIAYIVASFFVMSFIFKNYKDLGFEVYATWSQVVAGKISNGFHKAARTIKGQDSGGSSSAAAAAAGGAAVGAAAGVAAGRVVDEIVEGEGGTTVRRRRKQGSSQAGGLDTEYGDSGYVVDRVVDSTKDSSDNPINQEIKKGAEIKDKTSQSQKDESGEK